jgi:hypothetical protein
MWTRSNNWLHEIKDSDITLKIQPQASRPQSSQLVLQLHSPTVWSQQSVLQLRCEGQCKVEISFRCRESTNVYSKNAGTGIRFDQNIEYRMKELQLVSTLHVPINMTFEVNLSSLSFITFSLQHMISGDRRFSRRC